VFTAEQYKSRT